MPRFGSRAHQIDEVRGVDDLNRSVTGSVTRFLHRNRFNEEAAAACGVVTLVINAFHLSGRTPDVFKSVVERMIDEHTKNEATH